MFHGHLDRQPLAGFAVVNGKRHQAGFLFAEQEVRRAVVPQQDDVVGEVHAVEFRETTPGAQQ